MISKLGERKTRDLCSIHGRDITGLTLMDRSNEVRRERASRQGAVRVVGSGGWVDVWGYILTDFWLI